MCVWGGDVKSYCFASSIYAYKVHAAILSSKAQVFGNKIMQCALDTSTYIYWLAGWLYEKTNPIMVGRCMGEVVTYHQVEDELFDLLAGLGADVAAELDEGVKEPLHLVNCPGLRERIHRNCCCGGSCGSGNRGGACRWRSSAADQLRGHPLCHAAVAAVAVAAVQLGRRRRKLLLLHFQSS